MPKRPKSIADLPSSVPLLPLSGAILFPRLQSPLQIFEARYIALVDDILGSNRLIGLVQPELPRHAGDAPMLESPPERDTPLHNVGTFGYLAHFEELSDNRYLIGLEGICRFEIGEEVVSDTPYRRAEVSAQRFAEDFDQSGQARAVDRDHFVKTMRKFVDFMDIEVDWEDIEQTETADLINLGCMMTPYGPREKQLLLEGQTLAERADTLLALVEMQMAQANSNMNLQ